MAPANDVSPTSDSSSRQTQVQPACKQPPPPPPETNNSNDSNNNRNININCDENDTGKRDLARDTSGAESGAQTDKASVVVIETRGLGQSELACERQVNGGAPALDDTRSQRASQVTQTDQPALVQAPSHAPTQQQAKATSQSLKLLQRANQTSQQVSGLYPAPKRRRLSYLQSLLLRRWPYLALSICIMSSLLFGVLLSALTVYLMHAHVSECMSSLLPAGNEPTSSHLQARIRPELYMDPPMVEAGGASPGSLGALEARSTSSNSADSSVKRAFQRLPTSLWPIHYDLFIQPYLVEPFNFDGKVSIRIKCSEPTDNITLHTNQLEIDPKTLSLTALGTPASAPKILELNQDQLLQYSIVKLDANLEANKEYLLGMDFSGSLNDDLSGFYKMKYQRQNSNETTWIAATQFQATDARQAFPCFDEPLYKATFSIQIKHWKNMTALSNMPIVASKDSPDGLWVTDTFDKTHRMSTYLVAYAVTNFESRSEGNISVWTRPGLAHTAEYALKIAGKILRYYEDFFGIEYPLPKMDMIALPDFNAGAMENWGLITYRETAMLYDERMSTVSNKQRVAVVVAHELAHQWFGNLVTPKWWDDLWLNEGFASYVEYIGVDHVEPKWRMLDQFVTEEVHNVFKLDGLSTSHQISIPVNNPDEISEIFDHISYAKGASVIRMMSHFLTNDVFKLGLRRYLRALKYNNAEQSDLWAHLTDAQRSILNDTRLSSPVDVEKVMNSWTLQSGLPLVTLNRRYSDQGLSPAASLEQMRYRSSFRTNSSVLPDIVLSEPAKNQSWDIPVTYTWKSESNWEPRTRLWLYQNQSSPVELNSSSIPKSDSDWMLLNINQVGYYRVNYDMRNWKLLVNQLFEDHQKIGLTNRAQLLDDMFEFARNGLLNYNFVMEVTKYLKNEREYLPWNTLLMALSYVNDMLQRTPVYGDWRDYLTRIITPYYMRYKDVEWTRDEPSSNITQSLLSPSKIDKDDVLEQYNQAEAISWGCELIESCVDKAKEVFASWRRTGVNKINPALRLTTYCTAIEHGKKGDWEFLWKVYEREQNANERDRILRALACTKELWILSRYLEWTFDKTKPIRRQDGSFVFRLIAGNNYGRDVAFNFMRDRWQVIKDYYGKSSFALGGLVRSVGLAMNTKSELNQLITFYESVKSDVGTGRRSFQNAIEQVEENLVWREKNYKTIENWILMEQAASLAPPA